MAETTIQTQNGRFLFANSDDLIARMMAKNGHWEIHICEAILKALGPRDVIFGLDIGANIGAFSVQIASLAQKRNIVAKIDAFEVQPRVFENLMSNVEINNLSHVITPHNVAISDSPGEIEFDLLDNQTARNSGAFSLDEEIARKFNLNLPASGRARCQAVRLDDFGISGVDFIKLDVEGMEFRILKSIEPYLREKRPVIALEIWSEAKAPWYQDEAKQILKYLRSIYTDEVIVGENYIFYIDRNKKPLQVVAELQNRDGRHHEAVISYRALLRDEPERWNYSLGVSLRYAGDDDLAIHYLRRHEKVTAPSVLSRRQIAYALQHKRDFAGAKRTLIEALDMIPSDPNLVREILRLVSLALTEAEIASLEAYCDGNEPCLEVLRTVDLAQLKALGQKSAAAAALSMRDADVRTARTILGSNYRAGNLTIVDDLVTSGTINPEDRLPIFAFWDSEEPPEEVSRNFSTWLEASSARQPIFSAASARAFIQTYCDPSIVSAFGAAHHPAMQADIFRLAKIQKDGGVYIDADERAIAPICGLWRIFETAGIDRLFVLDVAPHSIYVHNYFLAARAGDAVISSALERAAKNANAGKAQGDIWGATGPGVLTQAVVACLKDPVALVRTGFLSSIAFREIFRGDGMRYKADPKRDWRGK